jgi:hypothetical protein
MKQHKSGIVIRGKYIEEDLVSFGGRESGVEFFSPDPTKYVNALPLGNPIKLEELYDISFDEILDFLDELGSRLDFQKNRYLQEAYETTCITSDSTPTLIESQYKSIAPMFMREVVHEIAEKSVGVDRLEGWRTHRGRDGRLLSIRAFGSRALHIIAGNSPTIAGQTFIRNAITRSDAIIKSPSNDPFTALAIARTMIDMDADHPLTRHVSVGYWKGGDETIEKQLYQPRNIEKIVAWGGVASVKHVTKYIQPGLELISMDPKRSATIIGPEAFEDESTMDEVALRLATDIGAFNQAGCVSARVVYVISGTDDEGLDKLNRLAAKTYNALINLPVSISTKPKLVDQRLKSEILSASMNDEWYKVFGGKDDEGAIIASQIPEPVDFATLLSNRVGNLVPLDSVEEVFKGIDSYTQTVGIYPDSLKEMLRNKLPLYGAQRLTSLGYACSASMAAPWDSIEPERRMCKWIVEETCDPKVVSPLWESGLLYSG